MSEEEQHVNTDAQRMALEAMSAQLVHKLNAMIREQEERVRIFAEQHHSTSPLPEQPAISTIPEIPAPVTTEPPHPVPPVTPPPIKPTSQASPALADFPPPQSRKAEKPLRTGPRKITAPQEEESNIGASLIIFALVGITLLIRSCS